MPLDNGSIHRLSGGAINEPQRSFPFRFRLGTLLLMVLAFAAGLAVRNLAEGLHPLAMRWGLPKSDSPLMPGDVLLVESLALKTINRRVTVLADHTISLPILGELSVEGHTVQTLQDTLNDEYKRHLNGPMIQVYRADASQPAP